MRFCIFKEVVFFKAASFVFFNLELFDAAQQDLSATICTRFEIPFLTIVYYCLISQPLAEIFGKN